MSAQIPYGQKESIRLELKGADALKEPRKIAREVVAMLNAEGGEVWVGIREEDGRAVALEPIANLEAAQRDLLNHLVDTIEPSLSDREVKVEIVREDDKGVLRVLVNPELSRRPYASLKEGGRYFVIRVGDRIRPMTREEILSQPPGPDSGVEVAEARVLEDRKALLEKRESLFWLRLEPGTRVTLDIQAPELETILRDPRLTDNRADGWNFSNFDYRPQVRQDRLVTDPGEYRQVEIRRNGGLVFSAPLESLSWREPQEIWPPILLEYLVSAMRMARLIYNGDSGESNSVIADLVLAGVGGWILRSGTPNRWSHGHGNPKKQFSHARDFVLTQPLVFRYLELKESPDRCGQRLAERVYESFGIRRENMPKLFDSDSGRLVFPA